MLLVVLIGVPLLGAAALLRLRNHRADIPLIASSLVLVLATLVLRSAAQGGELAYKLQLSGPFVPSLRADALSMVFVLAAAFLWWAVSIYSPAYMHEEGRPRSFAVITLLTLAAVMGVFFAGDFLTLLLFFELMTIASYFWVVHRRDREAIRAGYFYLFFSIIGGLCVGLGIVLIGTAAGRVPTVGGGPLHPLEPRLFKYGIAALLAGFGIKAGMVPLHLWLPHAHSTAPTPGSALLSGLLIKVGAYGLIRTGELAGWGIPQAASTAPWLGTVLIILGVCTMLAGVAAALLQNDAKRLLAYHSVSQMGYIILGLGLGLYLGSQGGLGLVGAIYHIVNHALFKAALFLGVGVIYVHTRQTSLYRLGGLWRDFPITALLMLLAALGITGAPGLNGYASKTLLHHAASAAASSGEPWLVWVERLFLLVGVGTAASFTKLYYLMFLGKAAEPAAVRVSHRGSKRFHISMGLLAVVMVGIGLKPDLLLGALIVPAAEALGMNTAAPAAAGVGFWNSSDMVGMVITLALGMAVCWAGLKTGAFSWQPPAWLTLESLGSWAGSGIGAALHLMEAAYRRAFAYVCGAGRAFRSRLIESCRRLDHTRHVILGNLKLAGIGADLALVMVTLVLLVVWYLGSPALRLPAAPLTTWLGMPR